MMPTTKTTISELTSLSPSATPMSTAYIPATNVTRVSNTTTSTNETISAHTNATTPTTAITTTTAATTTFPTMYTGDKHVPDLLKVEK